MKKFFAARSLPKDLDFILLLIRLVVGYAFILHGWGKIQHPMNWMGNSPVPGILQALAALSEFGGGIALILGLLTRLASVGLVITMFVAIIMHAFMMGDPFVNTTGAGGSYEPATVYFLMSVLFLSMGPGRFSIDKKIFGVCESC